MSTDNQQQRVLTKNVQPVGSYQQNVGSTKYTSETAPRTPG